MTRPERLCRAVLGLILMVAVVTGCATGTTSLRSDAAVRVADDPGTASSVSGPPGPPPSGAVSSDGVPGTPGPSVRDVLGRLVIDDRPTPDRRYSRQEWPHWADIDGDRCDARQQALIAQSVNPAQVDPARCTVIAGDWLSSYDGFTTEVPGDLDMDHVVPLENAHTSGGWRWDPDRRRAFANNQDNLLAVSARSNRSKGARSPDQWRPPRPEAWCQMASIWVEVKVDFDLTATTAERDALGQMLDTCP